ncbi:sulfatase [Cellulophaga sp. F20128]|uniref:sulfatase family protein n=1 Tax=Cellulophaga sp. F20128 TaxID=2926413 RepID=UPI001FF67F01|nr:sulfatase [Cellulophaga sp. F20128]MCK0155694.1 sulfatase [Cellulophaga sp. F20128]
MSRIPYTLLLLIIFSSCKNDKKTTIKVKEVPPNIVLIFTDDQGYQDVGVFGSPNIKTPHIDKMSRNGVKLTNYYSAQPICSASRAGILTGCYPNRIGIHNALGPGSPTGINSSETTIAEMLKSIGYKTAIYGKWHLGDNPIFMPTRHGFDEFYGIPYSNDMWPNHPMQGKWFNFPPLPLYENETVIDTLTEQSQLTTWITEKSVDFINRNKDNPFFLYVPHPQPHVPLYVSDKFKGKSERGLYGDVIMELDWSVGQIIEALQKNGLEENTLVIFTSDNGPWLAYGNHAASALPLREGKGSAWEGGSREPFVMQYPKKITAGRTINTTVNAIDLLPTFAEITGAPLPTAKIDGKSAWKVFTGESDESPQEAYFIYYRVNELMGVRYKNWKLYFPHKYRTMDGQEPGKDGLPGAYRFVDMEKIELYDLDQDISETNNVADQHPEVIAKIKVLADEMRRQVGDSLTGIQGVENREPGRVEKATEK